MKYLYYLPTDTSIDNVHVDKKRLFMYYYLFYIRINVCTIVREEKESFQIKFTYNLFIN